MATTPEGRVKTKIKALLKKYRAYVCMPATGGFGVSGHPDFLVCLMGAFIGIEAKAAGGRPTALQMMRLQEIIDAGGIALVVDETNLDVLESILMVDGPTEFPELNSPILPPRLIKESP